MANITLTRSQRYGRDRIDVTLEGAGHIGWYDVDTKENHVTDKVHVHKYRAAVAAFRAGEEFGVPHPHIEVVQEPIAAKVDRLIAAGAVPSRGATILPVQPHDQPRATLTTFDAPVALPNDETLPLDDDQPAENLSAQIPAQRRPMNVDHEAQSVDEGIDTVDQPIIDIKPDLGNNRSTAVSVAGEEDPGVVRSATVQNHDLSLCTTRRRKKLLGLSLFNKLRTADAASFVHDVIEELLHQGQFEAVHDVPAGHNPEIDHIVLGRCGPVVIRVVDAHKQHVTFNGDDIVIGEHATQEVAIARAQTDMVRTRFAKANQTGVFVTAVVVVGNAVSISCPARTAGVSMVEASILRSWILARPIVHGREETYALFDLARQSTMWV